MKEFFVQSGPLKITVVAEDAHDAAIEALSWWGVEREMNARLNKQAELDSQIVVRPTNALRPGKRFSTFSMLARASGEAAVKAWNRLLHTEIAGVN